MNYFIKILTAIALAFGIASVATAADLPKRNVPLAPIYVASPNFYVGAYGGGNFGQDNLKSGLVGVNAGYWITRNFALEVTYDHAFDSSYKTFKDIQRDTVAGNLLVAYPIGRMTPYMLGGVGYQFRDGGLDNTVVLQAGAGVKYSLTSAWELDGRYRYRYAVGGHNVQYDAVHDASHKYDRGEHLVTVGVNYKF